MIFSRPDYQERIVECDVKALRELFSDILSAIPSDNETASEEIRDFNYRFENCFDGKIPKDEPVFLLRGQDHVAHNFVNVVRAWAHQHSVNGGSDPMHASAMRQAELMERWAKEHGKPHGKPADGPVSHVLKCSACGGDGVTRYVSDIDADGEIRFVGPCPACNGSGLKQNS